ncbi:MAG: tetratricopeptide repeat protein [Acidobacteria bacterium]|nr:tetratricopeptide repeat protein [Acidobacteriota bacterium]
MSSPIQLPAWKKALFAAVAFLGFFGLLEGTLAVLGVRPRLAFDDPYVGFAKTIPLFVRQGDEYVSSPAKAGWFNLQRFPVKKPEGTFRIFSVGGSTTYGRPYDDKLSFSGWLRELLPAADPIRRWEVINAGGVSYASYRVAAVMEELAQYDPDLFLIYSGHNEFLERRTYEGLIDAPETVTALGGLLSRTRIYSAGARLLDAAPKRKADEELLAEEVDTMLAHSVGPEDYERNDEFRSQVLAHYRFNLRRMVDIARAAGAEAVLITPASNWKDCSPFKNQSRDGLSPQDAAQAERLRREGARLRQAGEAAESLAALDEALALDDRYAETYYERGRALLALDRPAEAKASFERALDEDVCPLRAFPAMTQIVRDVARQTGAPLVDFDAYVQSREDDGIPGSKQFLDHVHLNVDGYRELALLLVDELEREGRLTKAPGWDESAIAAVRVRVEAGLDRKERAQALKNLSRVFGWAGKMEESARIAEQALDELGSDPDAFNTLGRTAAAAGRRDEAIDWFRKALAVDPSHPDANTNLGAELFAQGKIEEAIPHFQASLRANPDYGEAHLDMGLALSARGDAPGAERHFRLALKADPRSYEAHNNLGVELVGMGRVEEAVEHFRQAVRWQPRYADAYSNLGDALARLGWLEESEKQIRQALALGPETAAMQYNLGVTLQLSRRMEPAIECYTRAIALDANLGDAYHNRAVALMALGRDEEAVADLRQAMNVDPEFNHKHPEISAILAGAGPAEE